MVGDAAMYMVIVAALLRSSCPALLSGGRATPFTAVQTWPGEAGALPLKERTVAWRELGGVPVHDQ